MRKVNLNSFELDRIEYFNEVHDTLTCKSIKKTSFDKKVWVVVPQEILKQKRSWLYNTNTSLI